MASAVKFAYVKKSSIQPKITSGIIDSYDYALCSDTNELIFIDGDLNQVLVRPRMMTYDSVTIAETELNKDKATYTGQWVAIKNDDGEYSGYVVNKNADGKFFVTANGGGNNGGVKQFSTYLLFPTIGEGGYTYYDQDKHTAYVWDEIGLKYYQIGGLIDKVKADQLEVDVICGGNATE